MVNHKIPGLQLGDNLPISLFSWMNVIKTKNALPECVFLSRMGSFLGLFLNRHLDGHLASFFECEV